MVTGMHKFQPDFPNKDRCAYCTDPEPEHDLKMMATPDAWPAWPLLPLKRYAGGDLDCAFILEQPRHDAKVLYLGTMFEVNEVRSDPSRQKRYETFADIYADGWRVD
jgi:hypothetical protein